MLTHYPRACERRNDVPLRHRRDRRSPKARKAAGDRDVRLGGGGVSTVRQYLTAGLLDEVHLAVRPVLLGAGENLFKDLNLRAAQGMNTHEAGGGRAGSCLFCGSGRDDHHALASKAVDRSIVMFMSAKGPISVKEWELLAFFEVEPKLGSMRRRGGLIAILRIVEVSMISG